MEEMIPFLRMIAENPDDDAPRLVFADWLDEHEHHERAEFIRLQIELARMDPSDEGYPEKTARMRRCGIFTTEGKYPYFDHVPSKNIEIQFHRGFIDTIRGGNAKTINIKGYDILPLQTLFAEDSQVGQFKHFKNLKRLSVRDYHLTPSTLLEMFGKNGWFNNLEQLLISELVREDLESGVIPKFDLPKLKELLIHTQAFYDFGAAVEDNADSNEEGYWRRRRPWNGLYEGLPQNALPSSITPLERYIWYSYDDCDFFGDEDWYWRGPTMESLLNQMKFPNLREIEVSVDYNDHEGGNEGKIAAPYARTPFIEYPNLQKITLNILDHRILRESPTGSIKSLRLYTEMDGAEMLPILLALPACSELESLYVENRGWENLEPMHTEPILLPNLKHLYLKDVPLTLLRNCEFPNLISFQGEGEPDVVIEREWPKLQFLELLGGVAQIRELISNDKCPNLTTLITNESSSSRVQDFLSQGSHNLVPHLSLISLGGRLESKHFTINDGKLIACRKDICLHEEDMFEEFLNDR